MILVGNSRGGARDLAQHLTKDENDHVTVHELRGFVSDDLDGAFQEAYAISRGTKCKQFLFSLSLNPPADADVSTEAFESSINQCEAELGLNGQPRAIVFHEKEGRRHAHAVWSRIDAETLTARQMSFHKMKLQNVARELYREHGWKMPEGLADRSKSDPRNYILAEWQQAKRADKDAGQIKEAFQDAWAISDNRASFEHALKERGYWLARGDRRGFVAIDHKGEVYSIPKQAKIKTKAVRERLGDENKLPSLSQAKETMARDMSGMLSRLRDEQYERAAALKAEHNQRKQEIVDQQRAKRTLQDRQRQERELREQAERQARFRKGLAGLWDRLRGEHKRLAEKNRLEVLACQHRDKTQRDALIFKQLAERRVLNARAKAHLEQIKKQKRELDTDKQRISDIAQERDAFVRKRRTRRYEQRQTQGPPDRGTGALFNDRAKSSSRETGEDARERFRRARRCEDRQKGMKPSIDR
ncbi:relaxase/mobilization nuclease domain-containing protein [uncultured Erythrobacter sp.]|uniref:relaxase/mobilization nuclease domain-containing protein n=1 Tax=uncultured Erythrobacter sp. TaxID=263913 RepID=UPI002625C7CA|nr:relaxase/mobilization nuclease domain-containing protein [uncultured Erythrobacter sp.]